MCHPHENAVGVGARTKRKCFKTRHLSGGAAVWLAPASQTSHAFDSNVASQKKKSVRRGRTFIWVARLSFNLGTIFELPSLHDDLLNTNRQFVEVEDLHAERVNFRNVLRTIEKQNKTKQFNNDKTKNDTTWQQVFFC